MHVSCLGVKRHHFPRPDAKTRVDGHHLPGRWGGDFPFVLDKLGLCGGVNMRGMWVGRVFGAPSAYAEWAPWGFLWWSRASTRFRSESGGVLKGGSYGFQCGHSAHAHPGCCPRR